MLITLGFNCCDHSRCLYWVLSQHTLAFKLHTVVSSVIYE